MALVLSRVDQLMLIGLPRLKGELLLLCPTVNAGHSRYVEIKQPAEEQFAGRSPGESPPARRLLIHYVRQRRW